MYQFQAHQRSVHDAVPVLDVYKRQAKDACEREFDAVFCMGGDGTVNETVNGIAQGGFKSTFGFIPVGTVNDMSRALGIHQNPDVYKRQPVERVVCSDPIRVFL